MRKPLIAGNWKMFTGPSAAESLSLALKTTLKDCNWADIVVCPPFTSISAVVSVLKNTAIEIGAQDTFWESEGAYTGEISPVMIREAGCGWVIIGHSERRAHFGESDQTVFKRVNAAMKAGLKPIVCVGETLQQRDSGITEEIVKSQLLGGIGEIRAISNLTIAYEPVWAIGTGRTATPRQAQDVHNVIRTIISEKWGELTASAARILYGGSVKPDNAGDLWQEDDIDGFLVGGASLNADTFSRIIESAK